MAKAVGNAHTLPCWQYCHGKKVGLLILEESTNDQVKSLIKEEISNSITEQSQISKERAENATTWLYEALQLYANDNWTEGNQNQICLYLKTRFDTAYGPYWICMTSRKNEPVYGVVTYDSKEGLIMFNLPNGLAFEVIKPKGIRVRPNYVPTKTQFLPLPLCITIYFRRELYSW